jgi:hypothetical protein
MTELLNFDSADNLNSQQVIDYLDRLSASKKYPRLKEIELLVITGVWNDESYDKIAENNGYSAKYLAQIGPKTWKIISNLLSTDINKKNFKTAFTRYYRQNDLNVDRQENRSSDSISKEYCYIKVNTSLYIAEISIDSMTNNLRYSTGDFSIQIERKVIPGSAILFCNGSIDSMSRLTTMFANGDLTELTGLTVLDLNYMKVWLERLFSSNWSDRETILAGMRNQNIRSLSDLPADTEHSLFKGRLVEIGNINLIVSIELDYYSALEINVICKIYPDRESYLPRDLAVEILDIAGSVVMQERIETADIDAVELPFSIAIDERFSLKIIYHNLEIIEQF